MVPVSPKLLDRAEDALNHPSELIECDAVIREQWRALDGIRLRLSDGASEFSALLRLPDQTVSPPRWELGTRVRLAGVCSVGFRNEPKTPGTLAPQFFQILLRSPEDIQILQLPSWWNARHVAWLTGAVATVLLAAVALVIWIGHRRLRQQAIERMKSETEFAAVWNERNRLARELHDTLAQGLGTISLQLELAKRQVPADSSAQSTLAEAGIQTRASLDEVRGAIWNMRSQALEKGDLVSALTGVLQSMTDRDQVKREICVVGEPRRFAAVVENNLLRVAQEAIANAVKHAHAKRIEVTLKFDRQQFEILVSDDGRGFDPVHPPASASGFGLLGMRERATAMNGQLTVTAAPGKGCIVKLVLPTSACESQSQNPHHGGG